MDDSAAEPIPPLSVRFPQYLQIFGIGFVVASLLGVVWTLLFGGSAGSGAGYALIIYGTGLLLAGGATGGGYTNIGLGAVGSLFGTRGRHDDDYSDPDVRRGDVPRKDPMERLRKGLRPGKNPTAFWQVAGGLGYIALGVMLVEAFS